MTLIKFLSLNVRRLRSHVKRRALFSYLKNQKADFYCLQETFSLKGDEVSWAIQNGVGKLFPHTVENTLKVLAYYRDQILCLHLASSLLIQMVD